MDFKRFEDANIASDKNYRRYTEEGVKREDKQRKLGLKITKEFSRLKNIILASSSVSQRSY